MKRTKSPRVAKYKSLTDAEFINVVITSISGADLMRKLGYCTSSNSARKLVKRRCKVLNINFPENNYVPSTKEANKATRLSNEDYFVEGVERDGKNIKRRLRNLNRPYVCEICGQHPEWNGKELVLQVDHINGNHLDNRLENLRFVCPNCHSQTKTFAGKNANK